MPVPVAKPNTRFIVALLATIAVSIFPLATETVAANDQFEIQRRQIRAELDQNQATVDLLYQQLDLLSTDHGPPPTHDSPNPEEATRKYLVEEIRQYDDRSDVLYAKLDDIDAAETKRDVERQLLAEADRLEDEAGQLRHSGLQLAALGRAAKARMIRKSLETGTWQAGTWQAGTWQAGTWQSTATEQQGQRKSLAARIAQAVRIAELEDEVTQLRVQLQRLRANPTENRTHGTTELPPPATPSSASPAASLPLTSPR